MSDTDALSRIEQGINSLLKTGHRIVWWSDPEQEFAETITDFSLSGAKLISLDEVAALAVKRQLEVDEPNQSFVLYESDHRPIPEEDWLLDIRLYAAPFSADATAMLQQDLGLRYASLRDHLKRRARFFGSKDRTARLKSLLNPDDLAHDIDAKMWAVLSRTVSADNMSLWLELLCDVASVEEDQAFDTSTLWHSIVKFDLEKFVWSSAEQLFGYQDETPSLSRFIPRLLVTDLAREVSSSLPVALTKLTLPSGKSSNVAVFLSQWRDSATRQIHYDKLSARLAIELKVAHHLSSAHVSALANCFTFIDLERMVANALRDQLLGNQSESVYADVRRIVAIRLSGYWVSDRFPDTEVGKRSIWRGYYQALLSAADLFEAITQHTRVLSFPSAAKAYVAYANELFKVDQHYRLFHEYADVVSARFPDAISTLSDQVESAYINQFLKKLATHWDGHLSNGLLTNWSIPEVPNQQTFYKSVVEPYVSKSDERRMFVIISDALRYEVADELSRHINRIDRVEANLRSQLGVLPSYTKLGMASLLPHQHVTYNDKGFVEVDGRSSDGLDNRKKILEVVQGTAVKSETLASMGKQALRDFVKPFRVVYIYHNAIDAVGDSASTESSTWAACRQAINEIADLVSRLVNNASATNIVLTADHGFLFQETPLEALEKSQIGEKPAGIMVAKKRYVVGHNLGQAEYAHHGATSVTAGTSCQTEFWLPRGTGRFHFVGGARFVHGGATLQEVVVPIIEVRQKYKKSADSARVKKVGVNVLGQQHRITTSFHMFTLLQTEPVGDKVLANQIFIELVNNLGEAVSSRQSINLDSDHPDLGQRQTKVSLNMLSQAIKSYNEHFLVISDAETDLELQRIPVRIDLAIENDFDF